METEVGHSKEINETAAGCVWPEELDEAHGRVQELNLYRASKVAVTNQKEQIRVYDPCDLDD